jgi:hypothetical protein
MPGIPGSAAFRSSSAFRVEGKNPDTLPLQQWMRGCRGAQKLGERVLCIIVHMVLAAEKDHFVRDQCLVDLGGNPAVQVAAQVEAVDSGADVFAQLHNGEVRG